MSDSATSSPPLLDISAGLQHVNRRYRELDIVSSALVGPARRRHSLEQGALNQPREVLRVLLGSPSEFASELPPGSGHRDDIDELHRSVDRPPLGETAFCGDALDDRPNVHLAATHPIPPGGGQRLVLVLAALQHLGDPIDLGGVPTHRLDPPLQALDAGGAAVDMGAELYGSEADVDEVDECHQQPRTVTEVQVDGLTRDPCPVGNIDELDPSTLLLKQLPRCLENPPTRLRIAVERGLA